MVTNRSNDAEPMSKTLESIEWRRIKRTLNERQSIHGHRTPEKTFIHMLAFFVITK